jgi:hypothetical protein
VGVASGRSNRDSHREATAESVQSARYLHLTAQTCRCLLDNGEAQAGSRGVIDAAAGRGDLSFSAKGETLAAVGALPLGDWDLHLKAGVLFGDVRLNVGGIDNAAPFKTSETLRTMNRLFGAGAGYDINAHWHAQFDWTRYFRVGSGVENTGRINGPNIDNLAMGISYRF